MSELALVVAGAVLGAIASGGVQAYERLAERRSKARVAARVILGDLYVLDGACELIIERQAWPDRLDLEPMVEAWREQRAAFARGVEAWEWALVDGLYSNLVRTIPMVRRGKPCDANDLSVVRSVQTQVGSAREVVLKRTAKERELVAVQREIEKRRELNP